MTEEQAVEAITQRWITGWDALNPIAEIGVVPYTFEGETATAEAYWARVTIIHTSARQITVGGTGTRRIERMGRVWVQLFADLDRGRQLVSRMADAARSVIELQRLVVAGDDEPVVIYSATTNEVDTEGRWVRSTINAPFVYYQTR